MNISTNFRLRRHLIHLWACLPYVCTSLCICLSRPCRNKNLTWFNVHIDMIKKYFKVWWYKRYMDLLLGVIQCFIFLCLSGKSTRTYMVSLDYSPLRICFQIWKISKNFCLTADYMLLFDNVDETHNIHNNRLHQYHVSLHPYASIP